MSITRRHSWLKNSVGQHKGSLAWQSRLAHIENFRIPLCPSCCMIQVISRREISFHARCICYGNYVYPSVCHSWTVSDETLNMSSEPYTIWYNQSCSFLVTKLAIANRSRVSWAHNTASVVNPWPLNLGYASLKVIGSRVLHHSTDRILVPVSVS